MPKLDVKALSRQLKLPYVSINHGPTNKSPHLLFSLLPQLQLDTE
jgi:hypothetical protein